MKKVIILLILCQMTYLSALTVHYIDVMQGDAILIQNEGANYLIDSGKSRGDDKLLHYLQDLGIETIDACLMTHPDFDHYGEFEDLIECEWFEIEKFIKNQDSSSANAYGDLMEYLENYQIPIEIVDYQSDLNWNVETDILSPNYDNDFNSTNENSIVIKMVFGEISFLFTGDSEEDNNNYLLDEYDMNIDVLKVSHHGATNGTNLAFIEEATPAISVLSSGNNSYGHPNIDVTQMLLDSGSVVYSTADDYLNNINGSDDVTADDDVVVETDGSNVWVNGELIIEGVSLNEDIADNAPMQISNYPNPFNPLTTIKYQLIEQSFVQINIFNIKGQLVNSLINKEIQAGQHSVKWNGIDSENNRVGSGIYFYSYRVNGEIQSVKKCIMLK